MALSPYRFSLDDGESTLTRPRTGLSSVTAGGGATSGGEGYRQSALMPGSRGYMAATFGGAPDPTYVAPTKTATVTNPTPTVTATQTAAPTVPQQAPYRAPEASGGEASDATMMGPEPANHDLFGDFSVSGKTVGGLLGGALGGLAFGPLGAVGGALAGRAIGSTFDGGGGSAPGMGGDPANAQSGASENSAANSGASQAGNMMGDGTYAEGGRVTHLFKGKQMHGQHKGGLGGVMAGGKNMGGYAEGGRVGDKLDAETWVKMLLQANEALPYKRADNERVAKNTSTAMSAARDWERYPDIGRDADFNRSNPMRMRVITDPMLREALIQQQGSVHPVNPGVPSTGNLGAYSMGGKVKMPNYAEGGTVDALAGPNPPGPDDGFAALDGGEFVVRRTMADKYAPILDDINEGRFPMPGQGGGMAPQGEGMGDIDLPMGAEGNMPPSMAESATPDDMMQRLATLPPEQRQSLQMAMSDPMLSGALFSLLGPAFMQVIAMLQQPMAPQGMGQPAMMATSPDLAGSRPMGGLSAVNA